MSLINVCKTNKQTDGTRQRPRAERWIAWIGSSRNSSTLLFRRDAVEFIAREKVTLSQLPRRCQSRNLTCVRDAHPPPPHPQSSVDAERGDGGPRTERPWKWGSDPRNHGGKQRGWRGGEGGGGWGGLCAGGPGRRSPDWTIVWPADARM